MKNKSKELWKLIMELLPKEPRSYDTADDPGFWTDGYQILCPSEAECAFVAEFLTDIFSETNVVVLTGYYDPEEDARNGEQDDYTGFYCIRID